jgi:hypothetical protein
MSILNLNGPSGRAPRSNGAVKVWMGIGLVIAVLGVGSTLASTITINGGTNNEFGQGVQRTVYCGGNKEITVTPVSQYLNIAEPTATPSAEPSEDPTPAENTAGSFYLNAIKVSDIPSDCSGVDFVISVYDQQGHQEPIAITTYGSVEIKTPTVYWVDTPLVTGPPRVEAAYGGLLSIYRDNNNSENVAYRTNGGVYLKVNQKDGTLGSFEIRFPKGEHALINDVGRIVIETQNDTFGADEIKSGRPLITPSTVHED